MVESKGARPQLSNRGSNLDLISVRERLQESRACLDQRHRVTAGKHCFKRVANGATQLMRRAVEPLVVIGIEHDASGIGFAPLHLVANDELDSLQPQSLDSHLASLRSVELDQKDTLPAAKMHDSIDDGDALTRAKH